MKATLFAVVLSLFIIPCTIQAQSETIDPGNPSAAVTQLPPKINLNTADVDALTQSFKGIGRKRAEAIIAYREANGGFKSLEDFALVKGIGKQFVEKNRKQLEEVYSVE